MICPCEAAAAERPSPVPWPSPTLLNRSWREQISPQQIVAVVRAGDREASRAVADAGAAIGRALAATLLRPHPALVLNPAATSLLHPRRPARPDPNRGLEPHSVRAR